MRLLDSNAWIGNFSPLASQVIGVTEEETMKIQPRTFILFLLPYAIARGIYVAVLPEKNNGYGKS